MEKETAKYSAVPHVWRKNIDSSIENWQKTFTAYCHDFNRAIVRVFIATHGNFDKTEQILRPLFPHLNVKNPQKYIESVISAAKLQFKKIFIRKLLRRCGNRLSRKTLITVNLMNLALLIFNFLKFRTSTGI